MATLRNKRKLAAVSRETPEGSRSSRAQNVLDPESAQDYISQVSREIEGRVTKKLSKEFSKTESRILGALSKLDERLLNPQARTCSVALPGTSRNNNSENRETNGDRSSDDPYPEVGYFSHHSGQLDSPETKNHPHNVSSKFNYWQLGVILDWRLLGSRMHIIYVFFVVMQRLLGNHFSQSAEPWQIVFLSVVRLHFCSLGQRPLLERFSLESGHLNAQFSIQIGLISVRMA